MILYRALNDDDMKTYYDNQTIYCSLINSYNDITNYSKEGINKLKDFYNRCYKNMEPHFALSLVLGHISGNLDKAKRSPWISLTSNFKIAYKYASLQKCSENATKEKNILCFEVNDKTIINNDNQLEELESESIIDFSNGQLKKYYEEGKILSFDHKNKDENNEPNFIKSFRISNYATGDNEFLMLNLLKLKRHLLLNPSEQREIIKNNDSNEFINEELTKKLILK